MGTVERYIIEFLLYGNTEAVERVQVSAPVDWTLRYPTALDTEAIRRVRTDQDTTGEPQPEKITQAIISPEVIYNTFFYISRAEELLNDKRDAHGRFAAQYSMLGEGDRLNTPIVDVYAQQLMEALDLPIPSGDYGKVCLTHDIDTVENYRHLRGAIGGIIRGHWKDVMRSWLDIHNDPAYTFPWLENVDKGYIETCQQASANGMSDVPKVEIIYFVKDTPGKGYDYPQYKLKRVPKPDAQYGLHSSYYGTLPKRRVTNLHRSHYLRCSIEQMEKLVAYGITDDYTMGFADKAGFRLQTCRPVRWVNPKTMELTSLVLHPLTVMDCTLSNDNYMNLNEEQALACCKKLAEQVKRFHGELVLLWHNSDPTQCPFHFTLYEKLIAWLEEENNQVRHKNV